MRVLLLFRGAPGSGKSTFIKEHGLKPYTLCADDIRLLYSSPSLDANGNYSINQNNDKAVWNALFKILETRMQNGEFTVIDATNSKTAEMNRYKELAKNYRYRIYCIDMTDIPIDEVKRRNAGREELKRVPEEVIDKMYSRFATQQIPSGIKVLKPEELDTIWYKPFDLSEYKKVHVIGDIHGAYTALKEYLEDGIKEDEYYIFLGDYIDRGIENVEVLNFLCEIITLKNTVLLEGNHCRWLWMYANDLTSRSKEFEFVTKPQLDKVNFSKKKLREFYRSLAQCCYFTYNGKTFLVTHGGISNLPNNITTIATEQMIKGVGTYNDADKVDEMFCKNTNENTYQIHGHRNVANTSIKSADRCYNLEGKVEFGGHLRAVQITPDGIEIFEIKNNVFKQPEEICADIMDTGKKDMDIYQLVNEMRKSRYIYEKKFGRISSFNFTKEAFNKDIWNDITTKARGLFVDTNEYKICARSYNKYFSINQRPETQLQNLNYKFKFPVTAYVKENGFLGIVGWNPEADDLLISSKSTPVGDFANYFKTLLYKLYSEETINKMKNYIKENNVSFVFECCDMENDPHIIKYPESKVVLLDVIKNQIEYEKLPYDKLTELANNMGFVVKEKSYVLNTWEEFYDWYNEVTDEDYKYKDEFIEGFVVEDSNGYMTKLKLHYYSFWKKLRGVAESVYKFGNYKWTGSLTEPIENEFFGWIKNYYVSNDKETAVKDICTLRKMFLEERK